MGADQTSLTAHRSDDVKLTRLTPYSDATCTLSAATGSAILSRSFLVRASPLSASYALHGGLRNSCPNTLRSRIDVQHLLSQGWWVEVYKAWAYNAHVLPVKGIQANQEEQ